MSRKSRLPTSPERSSSLQAELGYPNAQILTGNDDIELETTLQKLVLDLLGNRVETDIGLGTDFFSHFE